MKLVTKPYDAIAGVEAWAAGGLLEVCRMGILAAIRHHYVPGRPARRTWLRVQPPAGIRCADVGPLVGTAQRVTNFLVISMMVGGWLIRQSPSGRAESADLVCAVAPRSHNVGFCRFLNLCARVPFF